MGRPKAEIDWKRVDRMLQAAMPATQIADALGLGCSDTLYRACERDHKMTFTAYSQQKRASGDELLRMKQFDMAMKGDTTMAIFLGKNRLGQSDKQAIEHSGGIASQVTIVRLPSNNREPA